MQNNNKLTLNIYRVVDGGTPEIVHSQVVVNEIEYEFPLSDGGFSRPFRYSVPIAFTDFIATTGVPIEYTLGYTFEASSPSDPYTGQMLDYYTASVESDTEGLNEPEPVFIQERMDTAIAPFYPTP